MDARRSRAGLPNFGARYTGAPLIWIDTIIGIASMLSRHLDNTGEARAIVEFVAPWPAHAKVYILYSKPSSIIV